MPHVSQRKIDKKVYEQFSNNLSKLISSSTRKNTDQILKELLTETERTMLIKRLAAGVMFHEKCSAYQVWNTLKISPSTASRLELKYQRGKYDACLKALSHEQVQDIWNLIDKLSRGGLPPMGRGRWQFLNR